MKDKIDLPGAILVAALLLAGVGALAFKEANLGTTLLGLAIGIVMPSPMQRSSGGGNDSGSPGGIGGAALVLVAGLLTLQGCTDVPMPPGLSLLLGVLSAMALTGVGVFTFVKRLVAGVAVMLAVGCGGATLPVYAVATTACVSAEHAIVAREGTTEAEDVSALRIARDICDTILVAVRRLADGGES